MFVIYKNSFQWKSQNYSSDNLSYKAVSQTQFSNGYYVNKLI